MFRYVLIGLIVATVACTDRPSAETREPEREADTSSSGRPRIVFLGTSLTAGLGLDPAEAYPALIQRKLDREGLPYEAVNAGQSGETSAGSLARIEWVLREPAEVLVIETGANDGLRGLSVTAMRENIQEIIDAARDRPSPPEILLIGMEAPPNLGPRYTGQFRTAFADLARQNGTAFLPFLLTGVAGLDSLNQADGIHPTAEGQEIIAGHVWQALRPMLNHREGGRGNGE